jgi:uncharacterized damage-inducible protein DinB
MEDIRYPIGKFTAQENYTEEDIHTFIQRIEALPSRLEAAIQNLSDEQLDTPYRDGGWTVRQVVHHLADSHSHAYIRTKWTLTENAPVIKAYGEKLWATTSETTAPPLVSIALLKALHVKWVILLRSIRATERERFFIHPETKKQISINTLMGTYAWHGEHHLAHITQLRKLKNW